MSMVHDPRCVIFHLKCLNERIQNIKLELKSDTRIKHYMLSKLIFNLYCRY